MVAEPQLISSKEICERAGITYRTLDNWVTKGYATPAIDSDGSGTSRRWYEWQVGELFYLRRVVVSPTAAGGMMRRL